MTLRTLFVSGIDPMQPSLPAVNTSLQDQRPLVSQPTQNTQLSLDLPYCLPSVNEDRQVSQMPSHSDPVKALV